MIGIIVFAMVAIVLIVVIVLKTRTRVDQGYKVEEARTYHFGNTGDNYGGGATMPGNPMPSAPGPPTGGSVVGITGSTTLPGAVIRPPPPPSDANGFYANGATATVKKNGKPVREWYV